MYVLIDAHFKPSLQEPGDLKGFKLVVQHPQWALPKVTAALQGVAINTDADHAWIKEDWLRAQPDVINNPEWQKSFDGVVAYATKKGWVDAQTQSIRAHIEWSGAPKS